MTTPAPEDYSSDAVRARMEARRAADGPKLTLDEKIAKRHAEREAAVATVRAELDAENGAVPEVTDASQVTATASDSVSEPVEANGGNGGPSVAANVSEGRTAAPATVSASSYSNGGKGSRGTTRVGSTKGLTGGNPFVNKWFKFEGHVTATQYWGYVFWWGVAFLVVFGVELVRGALMGGGFVLLPIFLLATFYPWLNVSVRRGRDAFANPVTGVLVGVLASVVPPIAVFLLFKRTADVLARLRYSN